MVGSFRDDHVGANLLRRGPRGRLIGKKLGRGTKYIAGLEIVDDVATKASRESEGVGTQATDQQIVPAASLQMIKARASVELVCASTPVKRVVSIEPDKDVRSPIPGQVVGQADPVMFSIARQAIAVGVPARRAVLSKVDRDADRTIEI
jgi:hypothetical protein